MGLGDGKVAVGDGLMELEAVGDADVLWVGRAAGIDAVQATSRVIGKKIGARFMSTSFSPMKTPG